MSQTLFTGCHWGARQNRLWTWEVQGTGSIPVVFGNKHEMPRLPSCNSNYEEKRKGAIIQTNEPMTRRATSDCTILYKNQQKEILLHQYFKLLPQQRMF